MFKTFLFAAALAVGSTASAAVIDVDLSGASTGTTITAPGASFASSFVGQSLSGSTGLTGAPSGGGLTLQAGNSLTVQSFNPSVSPASNSILPTPGNSGPLAILLDSIADTLTFTAGSADFDGLSSFDIAFFGADGGILSTINQALSGGYNVYSFAGVGDFAGVSIFNVDDNAGLRYQNISYNEANVVPLPAGGLLLLTAFGGLAFVRRKKAA